MWLKHLLYFLCLDRYEMIHDYIVIVWVFLLVLTVLYYVPTLINIFYPKVNVPINFPYIFVALFFIVSIILAKNAFHFLIILIVAFALYYPIAQVWNICILPFSQNPPFIDVYDSCKPLSERYNSGVKAEMDAIMKTYNDPACFHDKIPGFKVGKSADACWRTIGIKHLGKFSINDMEKRFPILHQILSSPDIINVMISILDEGVGIPIHRGYFRGILRYQLGYIIPKDREKTFIVVGGQKYNWKEGEGVMFDDMYQHYVVNNTNEKRVVLYIDALRDNLPEPINTINKWFANLLSYNPILAMINTRDHKQEKLEPHK